MTAHHKLGSLFPLVKPRLNSEDHWHSAMRFHSPHHGPGGYVAGLSPQGSVFDGGPVYMRDFGGERGTWAGFTASTSVSPSHYHSTIAPYSSVTDSIQPQQETVSFDTTLPEKESHTASQTSKPIPKYTVSLYAAS